MTGQRLQDREGVARDRGRAITLTATRRQLLASSSGAALILSLMPISACDAPPPSPLGEPFDDGTFFDDGTGWVE
jgi:hypothetical protein